MTSQTGQHDKTSDAVVTTSNLPRYNPWEGITVTPVSGEPHGLDGFSLILAETEPGGEVPVHSHDYQEVFIVRQGCGCWMVDGVEHEAGPGDVVIAPAGAPHMFVNRGTEIMRHTSIQLTGTLGDALQRRPLMDFPDMDALVEG